MNIDVELIEKVVKKVLNDVETGSCALLSVILFFSYSGSFQFTVKSVILYK